MTNTRYWTLALGMVLCASCVSEVSDVEVGLATDALTGEYTFINSNGGAGLGDSNMKKRALRCLAMVWYPNSSPNKWSCVGPGFSGTPECSSDDHSQVWYLNGGQNCRKLVDGGRRCDLCGRWGATTECTYFGYYDTYADSNIAQYWTNDGSVLTCYFKEHRLISER